MADNIVYAVFTESRFAQTKPVFQYDRGQVLICQGDVELPENYQVHFANSREATKSFIQLGTSEGVTIPNAVLTSGQDAYAWFYIADNETSSKTKYEVFIPVRNRASTDEDEDITPEERSIIEEAIEALNEAVAKTAQDVIDADASAQSASGYADDAQTQAENAQQSATDAGTYAANAEDSATDAQTYATNAQRYANTAHNEAGRAATQASQAVTSALSQISFDINSDGCIVYTQPEVG